MKEILLILSCCTVSYTFSQTPFLVSPASDDQDKISSVTEVADGYIGTGYIVEDIKLSKIGFNGQVVWNKVISNNGVNSGYSIIKTNDGFAITGSFRSENSGIEQPGILRFNAAGSLQWGKQYVEGSGVGMQLLLTSNNGFLITGGMNSAGYLMKTDGKGNFKWSKKFTNVGPLNGLRTTNDHNYILLSGHNSDNSVSIIKVDTAGNILWSKSFSAAGHELYGAAILPDSDGGYLVTGSDFFGSYYGFIIRLDSLGNVLWSKLVNAGENNASFLADAVETNEKDFVLAGTFSEFDNSYYLIKIDKNGTLIWTKIFAADNPGFYTSIAKMIATSDGGYLAVGDADYSVQDGIFIKLSSDFNTCEPTRNIGSLQALTLSNKNLTISVVPGNAVANNLSFTISSGGFVRDVCGVLAVNLVEFNAALQKNFVQLTWQTATETNTSYFNIQRSTNGVSFTNIGKATAAGNSNAIHNYTYTDMDIANLINVGTIYYRLQTIDKDGTASLSKIAPVKMNRKAISLIVWPNPVKDKFSATIINFSGNADVCVYDLAGKRLYHNNAAINNTGIILNTSFLKAGTYLLQINANGSMLREKFIKE